MALCKCDHCGEQFVNYPHDCAPELTKQLEQLQEVHSHLLRNFAETRIERDELKARLGPAGYKVLLEHKELKAQLSKVAELLQVAKSLSPCSGVSQCECSLSRALTQLRAVLGKAGV